MGKGVETKVLFGVASKDNYAGVFAIHIFVHAGGDNAKLIFSNLIMKNAIRKEFGQVISAPLCGIFVCKNR